MKKLSIELLSNNTNIIIFNVSVKNKKHNPSWPEIPDHQYIIFTIGGSSSGKTNALQWYKIWEHWNILNQSFIKILNYNKSLCIILMLNWFKYFAQKLHNFLSKNVSILQTKYLPKSKMFQYCHIAYYFYHKNLFAEPRATKLFKKGKDLKKKNFIW